MTGEQRQFVDDALSREPAAQQREALRQKLRDAVVEAATRFRRWADDDNTDAGLHARWQALDAAVDALEAFEVEP